MPAIAIAAVSAGATMYAANKQKQAASDAASQQMQLAQNAMATPPYVKKSKNMLFSVLEPQLQKYLATGQMPQYMPESMTDAMYNTMRTNADIGHKEGRGELEQSFENRGMGYGNVAANALGRYDADYERQMASVGADIAQKGRMVNIQGWQDTLNKIYGLFSQGKAQQTGLIGQGLGIASDAIGANYAGQSGYYNTMAQIPAQAWGMYSMLSQPGSAPAGGGYAPTGTYLLPPNQ